MTFEPMEIPQGFDSKPEDGNYRLGKDGRWYTYQNCNIANRIFLNKKLEMEKVTLLWSNGKKPKKAAPNAAVASDDTPSEPKAPSRRSSRASVVPDTLYSEALAEVKEKGTQVIKPASKRTPAKSWDDYYKALQSFQEKYKTCNVPNSSKEGWGLANWVKEQRKLNADNELPDDRKEKLDTLGFNWLLFSERWDQQWNESCKLVLEYYETNGDFNVPRTNKKLFNWLQVQRRYYREGKLESKREDRLRSIKYPLDDRRFQKRTGGSESPIVIRDESSVADGNIKNETNTEDGIITDAAAGKASTTQGSSFNRLMPLIVKMRELVSDSCLADCANFLLQLIYRENRSKSSTAKYRGSDSDVYNRLLCLAMDLGVILDASKKSKGILECCENYFHHMIEKAMDETTLENLALHQMKRRKMKN